MLLLLVGFLIVVSLFLYWRSAIRRYPSGPQPWPIFGNLFAIDMSRFELQLYEWKRQFGPVFTIWTPFPTVIFSDYENGEVFAGRPKSFTMKALCGGNYGLVLNDNSIYKEQRKFALHALRDLGFSREPMERTISELAERTICKLKEAQGKPVELKPYLVSAVTNVMNKLVFGNIKEHDDPDLLWFKTRLDDALATFFAPGVMAIDSIPVLRHVENLIDLGFATMIKANHEIMAQLQKHKETVNFEDEPRDFVDAFLHEVHRREDETGEIGEFTPMQLLISAYDLYSAGTETTITTLRFGFHYLLNNPHTQTKLHEELDASFGDSEIRLNTLRRLPYLNAFFQELFRIANILPIAINHATLEDVNVNGYHLPAGTTVIPQFQSVHLDEKEFPRPNLFLPERFINEDGEFVRDERITPFSVGKRACLGETLARTQLLLFFSTFLKAFQVLPEDVVPPKLDCVVSSFRSPVAFKCRLVPR